MFAELEQNTDSGDGEVNEEKAITEVKPDDNLANTKVTDRNNDEVLELEPKVTKSVRRKETGSGKESTEAYKDVQGTDYDENIDM